MDRMTEDAAPITDADVRAARTFLRRLWLTLVPGGVVVVAAAALAVQDWFERRDDRAACEAGVAARLAALEQAPPADAVLHRGPGVVVVDNAELAALMVDGRVVASSLRCGPGERVPMRAWIRRGVL